MEGAAKDVFDFGSKQIEWLQAQLENARAFRQRPLVFTHLYPSELETQGKRFTEILREFPVELVEMGHTHYNELANDGRTIYAATRSTGQVEEGPPGFSLTAIDGDVISWKFKERGPWPFVMITSPADEKLMTKPDSPRHVVRGVVPIRAKIWGHTPVEQVTCSVADAPARSMQQTNGYWDLLWDSTEVSDGTHPIWVRAKGPGKAEAEDMISVYVNQSGQYEAPPRSAVDYENVIGAYPAKGILGTQLGPNENGTKGPWPSWRNR